MIRDVFKGLRASTSQCPRLADRSIAGHLCRSRRFNSRSTASRMKSERFSPSAITASIRAKVPAGNRAGICS